MLRVLMALLYTVSVVHSTLEVSDLACTPYYTSLLHPLIQSLYYVLLDSFQVSTRTLFFTFYTKLSISLWSTFI